MRKRIYGIVEAGSEDWISQAYDVFMIVVIIMSLIPLAFRQIVPLFMEIERVAMCIFIVDYLLRWSTADLKLKRGWKSFVYYPFTFMAVIDLLSILPGFTVLNKGFCSLRILRLFGAMRVLRVFKILRYSQSINIIIRVFRKQKDAMIVVVALAAGYIFVTALVMFNVEPRTFKSFFHALYWSTISLTTVGYGDLHPRTDMGRAISMMSALVGVAVIALPSSILTAGYMEEIQGNKEE